MEGPGSCAAPLPEPCVAGLVSITHPVPQYRQMFSWDCGLACAMMALHAAGMTQADYTLLRTLCPTPSIWTVDLAHLLRRFQLGVSFHTLTLGPNPAFKHEPFYLPNMQEDELRVTSLFHEAAAAGISLSQLSLSWNHLVQLLLGGNCLLLVLVDKCKLEPWLATADACMPYALCGLGPGIGYRGHYILLVGWDAQTQEFLVRDPATSEFEGRVSPGSLDAARRAHGTDEDLLVLTHPVYAVHAMRSTLAPSAFPPAPAAVPVAPVPSKHGQQRQQHSQLQQGSLTHTGIQQQQQPVNDVPENRQEPMEVCENQVEGMEHVTATEEGSQYQGPSSDPRCQDTQQQQQPPLQTISWSIYSAASSIFQIAPSSTTTTTHAAASQLPAEQATSPAQLQPQAQAPLQRSSRSSWFTSKATASKQQAPSSSHSSAAEPSSSKPQSSCTLTTVTRICSQSSMRSTAACDSSGTEATCDASEAQSPARSMFTGAGLQLQGMEQDSRQQAQPGGPQDGAEQQQQQQQAAPASSSWTSWWMWGSSNGSTNGSNCSTGTTGGSTSSTTSSLHAASPPPSDADCDEGPTSKQPLLARRSVSSGTTAPVQSEQPRHHLAPHKQKHPRHSKALRQQDASTAKLPPLHEQYHHQQEAGAGDGDGSAAGQATGTEPAPAVVAPQTQPTTKSWGVWMWGTSASSAPAATPAAPAAIPAA